MKQAAVAALMFAAISVGLSAAAPNDLPPAKHFNHADHASRGVAVDKCNDCHSIDGKGQVLVPAAQGHSPCLEAKCHASSFLAIGEKQKKADPVAFTKAASFCLGCHESVPWPWKKQEMKPLPSFQYELEYHVEMNHYEHTQKKIPSQGAKAIDCRSCHVVNAKSFELVTGTPGHAQCALCHNAKDFPEFTMGLCGNCHSKPARSEYFQGSRPKSDVRACASEGMKLLKEKFAKEGRTKAKGEAPCFRHERVEHRFLDKASTQPLECSNCHTMIDDKKKWHSNQRYQSLKDLHTAVIINNNGSEDQHKACGKTSACHKADVDTVNGGHCNLCHAEKWAF
jgi:hypothetical protein